MTPLAAATFLLLPIFALVDAHGRIVAGREPKSQCLPEGLSLEYLCMWPPFATHLF
jgi:hypothetical protein